MFIIIIYKFSGGHVVFLWITGNFYMTLDSPIGLYLDTKIFALSAFLGELESLCYGPLWPGNHLGAIMNKKMLKLNFYPPTQMENDPLDPYNDGSSEINCSSDNKGFPKKPLDTLTNICVYLHMF